MSKEKKPAKELDQGEEGLEFTPRAFTELCNPVSGEIDPEWYRMRLRFRHPVMYYFSMHSVSGRKLKRFIDVVFSLCALIALSPVFIITALAIRLESEGPIFFSQARVGTGGKEFPFFKFRSMVVNAEALKAKLMEQNESGQGVIFKMKNDPRVTKVGRIIRKFSIDELPQFYNVLRGDMSVVGPRPPVPGEVVQYQVDGWKRLAVIPGLTCVWQVSGRSSIGFKDQVKLDVDYILKQNAFFDLYLIYRTVPAVLKGEGAF